MSREGVTLELPAAAAPTNTHLVACEFDLLRPTTLVEALEQLSGPSALPMAGGTDLLVQMKMERRQPERVVSLALVTELSRLQATDGLVVGAMTSIEAVASAPLVRERYTALAEACAAFSTVAIMAMGTVGGNLCNASPASDCAPALLAFDATLELVSRRGGRDVPLGEFFVAPGRTVLATGELLRSVRLPERPAASGSAFVKVSRVVADISKVCVAVSLVRDDDRVGECRIALGSVAPTPLRVPRAELALTGRPFTPDAVADAERLVRESIAPITDQRSTATYRTHVAGVATGDALRTAWLRSGGHAT